MFKDIAAVEVLQLLLDCGNFQLEIKHTICNQGSIHIIVDGLVFHL